MNTRGLSIPHTSFGNVTSDDLFCDKEQALFDFYERSKTRYSKAIDIGANIGVHSILMVRNGWEVRAYEPDPIHFAELCTNCVNHHAVPHGLMRQAVSNRNAAAQFTRVLGNTTGSHLTGLKEPYGELETFPVEVVDAEPLLAWADFAKVDAEGAEAEIVLRLEPSMTCELMVEIGNERNALAILGHLNEIGRRSWSQKTEWKEVRKIADMPAHHTEGALFIGDTPP